LAALQRLDLVSLLRDIAAAGKPLLGICLGMQLLMEESAEFGRHRGLGLIEGDVVRLEHAEGGNRRLKVPQVGWNRIHPGTISWEDSLLQGIADGEFMYFVHSFYVRPTDPHLTLSTTQYGPITFTSSLRRGHLFACQFHPERSGPSGIRLYQNFAAALAQIRVEVDDAVSKHQR
jgi:glutamine amidotransferase